MNEITTGKRDSRMTKVLYPYWYQKFPSSSSTHSVQSVPCSSLFDIQKLYVYKTNSRIGKLCLSVSQKYLSFSKVIRFQDEGQHELCVPLSFLLQTYILCTSN